MMDDILNTSENFLCELFLEYLMPVADVYCILDQINLISIKLRNPLVDFIIGVNFHVHMDRRFCKCFMYLKFENEISAKKSDFAIEFDNLYIYFPKSLPIKNTIDIIFYIADFAVGAARKYDDPYWYFYEKFYTCTRMRLTYSDRIENFLFSQWREWTLYGAMVGRLVDIIDPETFPNMLFSDVLRYKKIDAIDYLIENELLQYLRGSDFEKKLQKITLRSIGLQHNYDFDLFYFPKSTEISLNYLRFWVKHIKIPKVLILVGTYCSARTKIVINFIRTKLNCNIINILNINSNSFLYKNDFLFLDYIYLGFGPIDIKINEGRILKKNLPTKISNLIVENIPNLKGDDISNLLSLLKDNLVIYDMENDMVEFDSESYVLKNIFNLYKLKNKNY